MPRKFCKSLCLSLCLLFVWMWSSHAIAKTLLGGNKFDLFTEYLGFANRCDGTAPCRRATRALASKAVADAQDAGFGFLRVGIAGWSPDKPGQDRELSIWRDNPTVFWQSMDDMFDALDRAGVRLVPVFVWNLVQFPIIARETIGTMIRDQQSQSRRLLRRYIGDFVQRYRGRSTILFYELSNEMNLAADLDLRAICLRDQPAADRQACAATDHFSSNEMVLFSRDMVAYIKTLDPKRSVSSGFSAPRLSAWHLAARPQFAKGGADWREDNSAQWKEYLARIHEPFDIISIHIYPDRGRDLSDPAQERRYQMVSDGKSVAMSTGKPLFVGEFGDGGVISGKGVSPFMRRVVESLVEHEVQYAAFWEWEYTAKGLDQDFYNEPEYIDPSHSPDYVKLLANVGLTGEILTPSGSAGDNGEPHVVLTWPLACASVDRPIQLSAVASVAAGPVEWVEFLVDGKPIGTRRALPYRIRFDPLPAGSRKAIMEVRAFSSGGRFSRYESPVLLNGDRESCLVPAE